jgi:hypothetical protein
VIGIISVKAKKWWNCVVARIKKQHIHLQKIINNNRQLYPTSWYVTITSRFGGPCCVTNT